MRFQEVSLALIIGLLIGANSPVIGQRIQFPQSNGLRPIQANTQIPSTNSNRAMVPLNPATQAGLYPSQATGGVTFDPYSTRQVAAPQVNYPSAFPVQYPSAAPVQYPSAAPVQYPSSPIQYPSSAPIQYPSTTPIQYPATTSPSYSATPSITYPNGYSSATGYPGFNSSTPIIPGAGQSAIVGTYPNSGPSVYSPGVYPNSSPPALFPGQYPQVGSGSVFGNLFGNWFGTGKTGTSQGSSWFGTSPFSSTYNQPNLNLPTYTGPNYTQPTITGPTGSLVLPQGSVLGNWNPQGSIFTAQPQYPQFLRLFQGPRIRHSWIYGSEDDDALQMNDTDLSLAFAIPNFLYSTQPVFILPSFSVHNWEGLRNVGADLPPIAYSAFLDTGWQSDPMRILGAEAGVRVGVFSDFETYTKDSLRVMGRALGRIRLTPAATLKLGAMYLDRNKVKVLPAGGILWQPNPDTRFDLFFPEPKLAHYLATIGTYDTWWYVGGYYGGGAWTVKRKSGAKQSIDINDIRLVLGMEWGRNEQMREGRRMGFVEAGYVFQREVLFKQAPADDLDLQDSVMVRAGIGY